MCFILMSMPFFPPFYLVNSAVSNACSNLSQRGVNVCFLWCWQGAIIPRLWEQSLQQDLFELVAVGGKSMRNLMGFGSGCAVQSTGLWGSAQPNKWESAWLARAFCDSGWLTENSILGKNVNIFFSSSATSQFQHLCCILHIDWDEKHWHKSFLLCSSESSYLSLTFDGTH